ncbi:MAG: FtsQ-type POTRA domain-containing protein [Desulfobacteraceae bacterium]
MLEKKRPARKNRYKKRVQRKERRLFGRLLMGAKMVSLVAVLLSASAVFMVGYAAVTQSAYFSTRSILVQGQSRLSEQEVLKQAGIKSGENLLAINLTLVRKRLLAHPWISEASVAREIPGTIRIAISEHRPLAVLDLGRKFIINQKGRIFKEHAKRDPQALPVVTGIAISDISLGDDRLTPAVQVLLEVLELSKADKSILPYDQIRKLHMDAEMGITLSVWENERKIKLGFARFEYKYRQLKKLLPHLKYNPNWKGFQMIDLTNPDRIVVRL